MAAVIAVCLLNGAADAPAGCIHLNTLAVLLLLLLLKLLHLPLRCNRGNRG